MLWSRRSEIISFSFVTRLIQVSYALRRRLLGPFALDLFQFPVPCAALITQAHKNNNNSGNFSTSTLNLSFLFVYIIYCARAEREKRKRYDDELESKFEICEAVKLFSACHLSLFRNNLMRSVSIVLNSVAIPRQQKQRDTNCSWLADSHSSVAKGNWILNPSSQSHKQKDPTANKIYRPNVIRNLEH